MIREAIGRIVTGESLTKAEAAEVMEEIMSGQATPAQFGALVTALHLKGETVDEIAGFASVMRLKAVPVDLGRPVVDTCGTGGDGKGTFNISTTAAFVAAGAGAAVAKHGNRSMSSKSGSADLLEALGANVHLSPAQVRICLEEAGVGFMFAQLYHPAMKFAAGPRREIGIRTVFNILGPLTNPAGARAQVLGVAIKKLVEPMALALALLDTDHAFVVHGLDGVDEISIGAPTLIYEIKNGDVKTYEVTPEEFGFARASLDQILGSSADENAAKTRAILGGQKGPGRDVVVLNAAAALTVAGLASTMAQGVALATAAIDAGRAAESLNRFVEVSQRFAENKQ